MKSSSISIMMAAVIFAAAFAGIVLISDEADAVEAEGTPYTVTYTLRGSTVIKTADAEGYIVLLTAEDVESVYTPDAEHRFVGWITDENVVYDFGATIKLIGNITLNPNQKAFANEVYFDVAGEDRVTETINGTRGGQEVPADPTPAEGFKFIGWMYSVDGKIYSASDIKDDSKIMKIAKESVFTAQFEEIFKVSFVVDGITISETSTEDAIEIPANPSKPNFIFAGWMMDGEIISTFNPSTGNAELPEDFVFTEDTVLYAYFEPVQLSVTLVIEDIISIQTALYGQVYAEPKLPSGYSHWATMEVIDDVEVYTEFDFTQPITEDIVLYAQKAEKVYTVSFVSEGIVIGGPYDVTKAYTIPSDPVVEGKKFVGWFVGDYKVIDIKAYVADHAEQDIVLTASFTEADAPAGPGFFQTTAGQCVIVLLVVIILALAYAIYTNMFGLKDTLASFKLQRVKKE